MAAWGITEVEKLGSKTLQEVKLRLMDLQACRHFNTFDHNLQLCVGNPKKTKSVFKVILRLEFFSTNHCAGFRHLWKEMGSEDCQPLPGFKIIGLRKLELSVCGSTLPWPCVLSDHPSQSAK